LLSSFNPGCLCLYQIARKNNTAAKKKSSKVRGEKVYVNKEKKFLLNEYDFRIMIIIKHKYLACQYITYKLSIAKSYIWCELGGEGGIRK
jgi:hypothetical protein